MGVYPDMRGHPATRWHQARARDRAARVDGVEDYSKYGHSQRQAGHKPPAPAPGNSPVAPHSGFWPTGRAGPAG
jgi:hypothetical protein